MHTLHEFFFLTKSIEYLIAALFLISFTYFFMFVFGNGKRGRD